MTSLAETRPPVLDTAIGQEWRTDTYRNKVRQQIEEQLRLIAGFVTNFPANTQEKSAEWENQIFIRASNGEQYVKLAATLILKLRNRDPARNTDEYTQKIRRLQKYIEPLRRLIARANQSISPGSGHSRELEKMKSLLSVLNGEKTVAAEVLDRCEQALERMPQLTASNPTVPSDSSSSSGPSAYDPDPETASATSEVTPEVTSPRSQSGSRSDPNRVQINSSNSTPRTAVINMGDLSEMPLSAETVSTLQRITEEHNSRLGNQIIPGSQSALYPDGVRNHVSPPSVAALSTSHSSSSDSGTTQGSMWTQMPIYGTHPYNRNTFTPRRTLSRGVMRCPYARPSQPRESENIAEVTYYKHLHDQCHICLVDFENGDKVKRLANCKHEFHTNCLSPWLSKSTTCPVCRTSIVCRKSALIPLDPDR